ncbi:NAD-dependent epimerase/dehydratase family protein [Lysobacter silvisoli]|uniref:NAD-dependent epimerase/dehydratase family protein n=1 Tax=Lysobacter silvisoli TaxID=2293254 RepID=A0A371JZM0_9GAMM|nr:NAD-dependent epimerase/dehydratase family protein [Lysobacter silvisoli]RDZ27121.1 NAD-dependent epimerase/dehydratase family protein [Lysobacter silvisoli]
MSVLVIGGNGFLGSSLVEGLRAAGAAVRVLDVSAPRADLDWAGVDYRHGGLDDAGVLAEALAGVDRVYHLASTTVPGSSNRDPAYDVSSNLLGSLRLIQAMADNGVRRIVFFSSGGTVYGNPERLPVHEDHPLRPISSYGVVKVAIENYLLMYQRLGALDPLILRPSNPYGPRQSTSGMQGAIGAFLGKARAGEGVSIWGDGGIVRDYLYIDDLVELAVRAGASDACGIYNAGSGCGQSLNELCALVRELTGRPLPVEYLPGRDFDVSEIVLDIQAARSRFGWAPRVPLRDGIERTWQALQAQ